MQTHLSHVFLTSERVYKFRKPVDLGFACFASVEERNADCLREVVLNRRLAPDVYLGIAPLLAGGIVGPFSESLAAEDSEHCVIVTTLRLKSYSTREIRARVEPQAEAIGRHTREYRVVRCSSCAVSRLGRRMRVRQSQ